MARVSPVRLTMPLRHPAASTYRETAPSFFNRRAGIRLHPPAALNKAYWLSIELGKEMKIGFAQN